MPVLTFTKSDTTEDTVDELISRMMWITSRLDSKNVKRLDTNETVIKSADGTTYINGPVLEQRDSSGTLRLKQGYDSSSGDFVYALFNEAGSQTVGIDSNGNATFSGAISSSAITGGSITGTTINNGSGTFSVSSSGALTASSATITGLIRGSTYRTSVSSTSERLDIQAAGTEMNWYNSSNTLVSRIDGNFGAGGYGMSIFGYSTDMQIGCFLGDLELFGTNVKINGSPVGTGDITSVTAGSGLTGGGTSGAVTLNVDWTEVVESVAGQQIEMQYFSDHLEVRLAGGAWKTLYY